MKKLICLLAAAALLVCCALPAFAEASGVSRAIYIRQYTLVHQS